METRVGLVNKSAGEHCSAVREFNEADYEALHGFVGGMAGRLTENRNASGKIGGGF